MLLPSRSMSLIICCNACPAAWMVYQFSGPQGWSTFGVEWTGREWLLMRKKVRVLFPEPGRAWIQKTRTKNLFRSMVGSDRWHILCNSYDHRSWKVWVENRAVTIKFTVPSRVSCRIRTPGSAPLPIVESDGRWNFRFFDHWKLTTLMRLLQWCDMQLVSH